MGHEKSTNFYSRSNVMEDHRTCSRQRPGGASQKFQIGMEGPNGWPDSLALEPIINWEIERERGAYTLTPITANGKPGKTSTPWAVKWPDGTFDKQGHLYDDEDELIRALRCWYEENLKGRTGEGAKL